MLALGSVDRHVVEDSTCTALAAVSSFLIAHRLHMPEAYWAAISTIIVIQSTLGAALTASWRRFGGTVPGAAAGALLSITFDPLWQCSVLACFCSGWCVPSCGLELRTDSRV